MNVIDTVLVRKLKLALTARTCLKVVALKAIVPTRINRVARQRACLFSGDIGDRTNRDGCREIIVTDPPIVVKLQGRNLLTSLIGRNHGDLAKIIRMLRFQEIIVIARHARAV